MLLRASARGRPHGPIATHPPATIDRPDLVAWRDVQAWGPLPAGA